MATTWQQKTDAIKAAVMWASCVGGGWKFQKESFSFPKDNTPWFELRMGRIRELGVDEKVQQDNLDAVTGLPDTVNPRKEVICGQRNFTLDIRLFSADQEHDSVAWVVAERTRTRLRMAYATERFFRPAEVAIAELFQVISMPTFNPDRTQSVPQPVDQRIQSEAVIEAMLNAAVEEEDAANVGTWIESIEVTSKLRDAGGTLLDPSIQLDNEVMP